MFTDYSGKEIVRGTIYITTIGLGSRITVGSKVKVTEISDNDHPYVYCYGLNGGSGYIKQDYLIATELQETKE